MLDLWLMIGLAGNFVFGTRFLVQWIASERAGRSTIPLAFWYLSIAGSLLLLAYAIHIGMTVGWKMAAPLVLSYAPNTLPYVRNIMLVRRERERAALVAEGLAPQPALGAGTEKS
jgi:lipid-A-disaccharide synthase-like uncharacterized protein